jgi:hypothetical protein
MRNRGTDTFREIIRCTVQGSRFKVQGRWNKSRCKAQGARHKVQGERDKAIRNWRTAHGTRYAGQGKDRRKAQGRGRTVNCRFRNADCGMERKEESGIRQQESGIRKDCWAFRVASQKAGSRKAEGSALDI